jgi:hypothetical protein
LDSREKHDRNPWFCVGVLDPLSWELYHLLLLGDVSLTALGVAFPMWGIWKRQAAPIISQF